MKNIVFVGIFLLLLICIPFAISHFKKAYVPTALPVPMPANISSPTVAQIDSSFTPPFYPGLSWTVDEKQKLGTDIKDRVIYYSSKNTFGHFGMLGKEWVATKKNISKEEIYLLDHDFKSYYGVGLSKLGWLQDTKLNGFRLSPMVADGPTGSLWGYIKVENGIIKAIILESRLPVSISGIGATGQCPCDITFRMFVSKPQVLNQVLPKFP